MMPMKPTHFFFLLVAVTSFAIFFELGRMDIHTDNEAQRATPPAEMVRSGDYVIPTINDVPYLVKPPLLYWVTAGVYTFTGYINEWTARIPTALAGAITVLLLYLLLRREMGETPARWTALAYLTAPYALERMRWSNLDIPLALVVLLTIWALWRATRSDDPRRRWAMLIGGGVAFGAALLLKGPPAFLFLGAAVLALLILDNPNPGPALRTGGIWTAALFGIHLVVWALVGLGLLALRSGGPTVLALVEAIFTVSEYWHTLAMLLFVGVWGWLAWSGAGPGMRGRILGYAGAVLLVGVVIAAPWGLMVLHRMGWEYVADVLDNQVIERTYTASRINSGPPYYYVLGLLGILAPWGLLLPFQASRTEWNRRPPVYRFMLLTGWGSVLLFSLIAGKEFQYIIPAFPLLLIPTGFHLADLGKADNPSWINSYARIWRTALWILLPIAAVGAAVHYIIDERHPVLAVQLTILALVAVGVAVAWRKRPDRHGAGIFVLAFMAMLIIFLGRAHYFTRYHSPRSLGVVSRGLLDAGYPLTISPRADDPRQPFPVPPLAFYTGREIPMEYDGDRVLEQLQGDDPYYYIIRKGLLAFDPTEETFPIVYGPVTRRDWVIVGSQPLPEELAIADAKGP